MPCDRPPEFLDTVVWERDGGLYSGIILQIRGAVADIATGHGGAMVYTENLRVILPREHWKPSALENHLWVVYGIRLNDEGTSQANEATQLGGSDENMRTFGAT